MAEGTVNAGQNWLLTTLDEATLAALMPHLEFIPLELKYRLYEPDKPIEFAYFPVDGVISMLAHLEGGQEIEIATVGNEGMLGLPIFLGADLTPGSAFSQVPGAAFRLRAEVFRDMVEKSAPFTRMLHRYTQALMIQISQGTACNRVHSIEERCARWLLLTHDRVSSDEFTLTQEFLGQMLGVRRASVNVVSSMFQQAGFIQYRRGRVKILDRASLESASCECYNVIRKEYERMLDGAG